MSPPAPQAPIRVALLGAGGRMGQAVLAAARGEPELRFTAALVPAGSPRIGESAAEGLRYSADLDAALAACDVLLDFSRPSGTAAALSQCLAAGRPLVTGVTGLEQPLRRELAQAARRIAVLAAPNMSLGVNLLLFLVARAAAKLGADFDVEILDVHHRHKRDAPSGTALALGEAVAAARGVRLEEVAVFDRAAGRNARRPGSIGFSALRAGEVVGEHSVLFAGAAERLELKHCAESRAAFARGALAAARWIADRPPGSYSMLDVLGLGLS